MYFQCHANNNLIRHMGAGGFKRKGKVNNILPGIGGYMLCQRMMPRLLAAMSVVEHAYVKTA